MLIRVRSTLLVAGLTLLHEQFPAQPSPSAQAPLSERIWANLVIGFNGIGSASHPQVFGIERPEWHQGSLDIFTDYIVDITSEKSIDNQLAQLEPTIKAALSNGQERGVLVQVKYFAQGHNHPLPKVSIIDYGPSPVGALNTSLSNPQLRSADPQGSVIDFGKSYMRWGILLNNKIA
jgi:hypothetical protein